MSRSKLTATERAAIRRINRIAAGEQVPLQLVGPSIPATPRRTRSREPKGPQLPDGVHPRDTAGDPLCFTVYRNPVPWQRAGRGGGFTFTPKRTRDYQAAVREAAERALLGVRTWPTDRFYRVRCTIVFEDHRGRDADNVMKSVLDACQGVLWSNDRQVVEPWPAVFVDPDVPRIDVVVFVLDVGGEG